MAKITKKQKAFLDEYMIDFCGTQAAIRAGYSPDTANEQASRMLANVNIKNELDKRIAEMSRRTGITAERVLMEYAKIAFVNPKDVIDFENATIKEGANDNDLAAVAGVKIKKVKGKDGDTEEREVKLCSKQQALDALAKHLGLNKLNVNVSGDEEQKKKLDAITGILMQMQKVDESEIAGDGDAQ